MIRYDLSAEWAAGVCCGRRGEGSEHGQNSPRENVRKTTWRDPESVKCLGAFGGRCVADHVHNVSHKALDSTQTSFQAIM